MTPSETLLLDTNILVYALDSSSEHHAASRAMLNRAQSADAGLCVAPQCLVEFFSLVTNPKRVSSPKSPEEALAIVELIASLPGLQILPVPLDLAARWVELCRRNPVRGAEVYDLQLVAVMLANGVHRICTFNQDDFEPFSELQVEAPDKSN